METAEVAQPIWGEKLYQQRARRALPILVRQALAEKPIPYEDLAVELGMPNPRNLNFVLGSIGRALKYLENEWRESVPPIQCLVVNKNTRLPGEGIKWFLSDKNTYKKLSRKQRQNIVDAELFKIYAYKRRWFDVLKSLKLEPLQSDFSRVLEDATRGRGGEGPEHKALKEYISNHPETVGLSNVGIPGSIEHALPSGDSIDVLFRRRSELIAVEVKPSSSGEADIVRGMYQCIKYVAVLEAQQSVELQPPNARAILALGGSLPSELVGLKNVLAIEVQSEVGCGDS